MIKRYLPSVLGAAVLAVAGAAIPAAAEDYPSRPITVVVPSSAGGPADVAARLIADKMSAVLGQQLVVETAPGAGGTIGMAKVARAAADGYTLLIHQNGFAITPTLYSKLSFDTEKDFVTIGLVNQSAVILVGRKDLPANNFKDLVAWAKGPGKPAKYAHPGAGTLGHLQTLMLVKSMGIDASLIAYRGIAPAVTDLLGGHIDIANVGAAVASKLIREGKVKGYAIGSAKRFKDLPDVPTFTEVGHKEIEKPFWHAMFAPAKTPPAIVAKLNKALQETLADPKVQELYGKSGVEAYPKDMWSQAASSKYVKDEIVFWGQVVRDNNVKVN
jgi:tripartite-type tricarboxylate transporter receptor subunit TctC